MGASSSSEQKPTSEVNEVESEAAYTGALTMLRSCFTKLADPQSHAIPLESLQQCFLLSHEDPVCESPSMPAYFPALLSHVGQSLVDENFVIEKGGVNWVEFLKWYVKFCGRMPASVSLHSLLKIVAAVTSKSGLPMRLEFESSYGDGDGKINGYLLPSHVLILLWMCWTMLWNSKTPKISKGKQILCLPDVTHLVLSAVVSCAEVGSDKNLWDCDISSLEVQLPVGKFLTWALKTVPGLTDCLKEFINARLQSVSSSEDASEPSNSSLGDTSPTNDFGNYILTRGRAWGISLSMRSSISTEIMKPFFPDSREKADDKLLYRSSLHGRGLNRFWSSVEGYHGSLLILVAATSGEISENSTNTMKWIIAALTHEGLQNKDSFYGSSGCLYAICPVFQVFSPSGKEKNFIYSHLHPTGRVYDPHPKPVGIAFGGTIGNERIFLNEDFSRVTVRHHAVDKTYQHGSLFPSQGFLPVEASVSEVEVWGLGGDRAKEVQTSYKKREELFTEQRRKVDLKTFANWEDSPEKLMLDMTSDPNTVRREDR
ncbi:hypothetical protein K2173_007361 [Erythroxylum novogranatense]|uniref:TLDc domain-containing protein n=1 Tax=Erythroxylum novogranatense TaxID=1862640 RepID=A0AAV8T616_9ROSI|nr:hypothetical protein K2173_007361 [Erythroxylum novogranatense]